MLGKLSSISAHASWMDASNSLTFWPATSAACSNRDLALPSISPEVFLRFSGFCKFWANLPSGATNAAFDADMKALAVNANVVESFIVVILGSKVGQIYSVAFSIWFDTVYSKC